MRRQTQQLRRRKLPNNYDIKNINSHFTKGTKTTKPMTGLINHVNKCIFFLHKTLPKRRLLFESMCLVSQNKDSRAKTLWRNIIQACSNGHIYLSSMQTNATTSHPAKISRLVLQLSSLWTQKQHALFLPITRPTMMFHA